MNNPGINTTTQASEHSYTETSSTSHGSTENFNRTAAVNTLAIVGFVALVGATMWLAVYSTRYVPTVVGRIGAAAVYVGSFFNPSPSPAPVAATSTSNTGATSTPAVTIPVGTSTPSQTNTTGTGTKTPGQETSTTIQVGGSGVVAPYGSPDLKVTMVSVGYLTAASTDSYVASTSVPAGERPAIKFTVKNIGTNWSGTWRFTATIPARTSYTYTSDLQQSLAPGDSIDYTFGFDRANVGTGEEVTIVVNSDNTVADSNAANNSVKAYLNILGS